MFPTSPHPPGDRLEAFAAGELAADEVPAVEAHLAGCARCQEEVEGWAVLFRELTSLPAHDPAADFADQVMARLGDLAPAPPARARAGAKPAPAHSRGFVRALGTRIVELVRGPVGALPHPSDPGPVRHLTPAGIQDYLEGQLALRTTVRVEEHLQACPHCSGEVAAWSTVMARLDALPRLSPSAAFADRVMERVPVDAIAAVVAGASVRPPSPGRRLAAALSHLLPTARRGWIALGGAMALPTVAGVALVTALVLNPLIGAADLVTFLAWQLSDVLSGAGQGALSLLGQTRLVGILGELLFALIQAPMAHRVALLFAGATTMGGALFIMYRNLYRPLRTRESHVQHPR